MLLNKHKPLYWKRMVTAAALVSPTPTGAPLNHTLFLDEGIFFLFKISNNIISTGLEIQYCSRFNCVRFTLEQAYVLNDPHKWVSSWSLSSQPWDKETSQKRSQGRFRGEGCRSTIMTTICYNDILLFCSQWWNRATKLIDYWSWSQFWPPQLNNHDRLQYWH